MANFTKKSPGIILPPAVEAKINEIADAYFNLTNKKIVITDGLRTPEEQAVQVYNKIIANDLTIYLNQKAAKEIKAAYDLAKAAGKPKSAVLKAMADVIANQVAAKVFLSKHLTGRAFDVRSNSMTPSQKTAFKQAVQTVGGATMILETKPPHFHLQLT